MAINPKHKNNPALISETKTEEGNDKSIIDLTKDRCEICKDKVTRLIIVTDYSGKAINVWTRCSKHIN